jgi:hypothetical protein
MTPDPVVSEVRKVREEIARGYNYDLHALCEAIRSEERISDRVFVTLQPRTPQTRSSATALKPVESKVGAA